MTDAGHAEKLQVLEAQMVLTYAALQGTIAALAATIATSGVIDGPLFAEGLRAMAANMPLVAKQAIEDIVRHMAVVGQASDKPNLRVVD